MLLPVALLLERSGWDASDPWIPLVLLGLVSLVASLFLYRAFELGVLSVVSPVASSYPAVTAALAFVALGERPGAAATAGIAVVLAGILVLSRARAHPSGPAPRDARAGLVSAFLAFAGYGVFYFALAYVVEPIGPVTSAAMVRGVGLAVLLGVAARGARLVVRPPRPLWGHVLGIAVLDEVAFLAYNVGIVDGSVAIIGTLSGLFSAVTVGLAAIVLRERLTRLQYGALAAVFAGVLLMALP
jgi:drug/metabolite transporter (DMT)-like permease